MDFHHFCSYVHDIEQEQADRGASKFIWGLKKKNTDRSLEMTPPNPSPVDAIRFHKFLTLPTELRLKIWLYSFPDGCYVQLRAPCLCLWLKTRSRCTWWANREWRLPNPNDHRELGIIHFDKQRPATLRVCREARGETLRHYIPLFKDDALITTAYFSPARDVLSLEHYYGRFVKELPVLCP
jgi:hypothetical protein